MECEATTPLAKLSQRHTLIMAISWALQNPSLLLIRYAAHQSLHLVLLLPCLNLLMSTKEILLVVIWGHYYDGQMVIIKHLQQAKEPLFFQGIIQKQVILV